MPPNEGNAGCIIHHHTCRRYADRSAQSILRIYIDPFAYANGSGIGGYFNLPFDIICCKCAGGEIIEVLISADSNALDILLALCAVAHDCRCLNDRPRYIFGFFCRYGPIRSGLSDASKSGCHLPDIGPPE